MKSNDDGNLIILIKREEYCRVVFIIDEDFIVLNVIKL